MAENEDVDVEKGKSMYRVLWAANRESIMPELEFMECLWHLSV